MTFDGTGLMALGDWSQQGILNNYSGGVRYSTVFALTDEEAKDAVKLWLETEFSGDERHMRRLKRLEKLGYRV